MLSNSMILNVAALAACIPFLLYVVYQRLFSPLANIPGPYLASITRLWLAYNTWRGGTHEFLPALHRKYGPVVRIAPDEV